MMVPESFNSKNPISQELKDFYEYHSIIMEPWDGPAALLFSDGRYAGGMLDRNGLRPCRYLITKDGMLMMASETGVMSFDANEVAEKGRLQPGKILLVDMETGKIMRDPEVKAALAAEQPYGEWLDKNRIWLDNLSSGRKASNMVDDYMTQMTAFGYSQEDIERIIVPMAQNGQEPTWSMGNDTPLAAFSNQPQRLFAYFRQQFAQVTNPPIDPIREKLVMSLDGYVGSIDSNLLDPNPELCKMVRLSNPILTNTQFDLLCNIAYKGFKAVKAPMLFPVKEGAEGLKAAVDRMCQTAEKAVDEGADYIILSDRGVNAEMAPVPSLLATSAVHSYLISKHKRVQIGLIVETAEPREVMHYALLVGFGASAINPYLAFATIEKQIEQQELALDYKTACANYIQAISKGLLKIMSKMGISTLMSYKGARIFEVAGLNQDVMDQYFGGADSKITGIGLPEIAEEVLKPHQKAFAQYADNSMLPNFGNYAYRRDGEKHAWNPETISTLQIATRLGSYKKYKEYASLVNDRQEPMFIRDFMTFKKADKPTPIDEVEPVESIMHRFATGAMSFGAISKEAHEALAVAMNAIGGRSNTGEGGEDSERFYIKEGEPNTRSAIKQVASGRFGVTTEYLVNADEIQIKIAQGAKPGEGGQLPGFKVNDIIAKTRHAMPGITLISPPPHHDIYSIEDLAQLIFDLKNVNPRADISVKLVSESGIGTIAAGVAKAKADRIIISGADGGTGASPASSTKHAGMSPEIGLAETQQTLIINRLRGQVKLQTDGQMKTGRDAMIMALLGAEEYAFATTALIVLGCVMMRKCHMNTCPVGVATQDPRLRARFKGRSEYIINFFRFVAQEMREYLSEMGFRSMDEVIGRTDLIETRTFATNHKTEKIDVTRLLHVPAEAAETAIHHVKPQHHNIEAVKDVNIIKVATPAITAKMPIQLSYSICNTDRAVGAMLSGEIARRYGEQGLPADTLTISFKGSAGQSFGAFLVNGVHFKLQGDANDYLGKGLSGGRITVIPPAGTSFAADENIICGNTLLYGATSGEVFINGRVGERFAVRNSGATAVVEGAGDHCCEYMTGGSVVVLGPVGRNFAAGMSAGVAYVLDEEHNFDYFCNMEMVELTLVEDIYDVKELRTLLERHYAYTGSPKAKRLLDNWQESVQQFIKVTPIEYKKVLFERRLHELEAKQVTHQE
jgi:glutamate synthase (NADPH/NADH) large chain